LRENGNKWHDGEWKGHSASKHRMSREAISWMNKHLIDQINATVGPDDTLWHLGDFAFAPKNVYYKECMEYRNRIKCKNVFFVFGNHDNREISNLFTKCYDQICLSINNQMFHLNHYCCAIWNKSHRGAIHLYGHSHSNAEDGLDRIMPGRKSMDVGVDNAKKLLGEYRPFSFCEIIEIMRNRPGSSLDHHVDPSTPTEDSLH
jgi:calcineurin-like phosphoesterase family protein